METTKEQIKRANDLVSKYGTSYSWVANKIAELLAVKAERDRYKAALTWIASFEGVGLSTALTLHYDMNGKAREALNPGNPFGPVTTEGGAS